MGYTYYRFGGLNQASDGTGTRTFNNDGTYPLQIDNETLAPGFYGGRILTTVYNSQTQVGGSYGAYTVSSVLGRAVGFTLGVAGNLTRDLQQNVVYSSLGQLVGVQTQAATNAQRNFTYTYGAQNAGNGGYAGLPSSYSASGSSFVVNYAYEAARPLLTTVNSQWTGASNPTVTRFDYTDTAIGQRASTMMSGNAFGDYFSGTGYSHVYRYNGYDGFGQLNSSTLYRGDTVSPKAADQLPGQTFQYRYDSAGNRTSEGETGSVSTGDDSYSTNADNQYSAKENNIVRILGTSSPQASVGTSPSLLVGQLDRTFGASLVPANASGPVAGSVAVTGTIHGPTSNSVAPTVTQSFFVGASSQVLQYDADGNLTGDGMWTYTYDAENRLISMVSLVAGVNGLLDTIHFSYDYLGRRVEKQVSNSQGVFDHKYLYEGTAMVAEISSSTGLLTRSYTWGPGTSAPLIELTNFSSGAPTQDYLPTFDGNRNLVSLVNASSGALAAVYEYGPFGELLRSQQPDLTVSDNPIRFSSEFTDTETGLVYYGQRYYSPGLGRFINKDPIGESGGTNLYAFCGNDSMNKWDFQGLTQTPQELAAQEENEWAHMSPAAQNLVTTIRQQALQTNASNAGFADFGLAPNYAPDQGTGINDDSFGSNTFQALINPIKLDENLTIISANGSQNTNPGPFSGFLSFLNGANDTSHFGNLRHWDGTQWIEIPNSGTAALNRVANSNWIQNAIDLFFGEGSSLPRYLMGTPVGGVVSSLDQSSESYSKGEKTLGTLHAAVAAGAIAGIILTVDGTGPAAESGGFAEGATSTWDTSGGPKGINTNVTADEFSANLQSDGYTATTTTGSNGSVTVFQNGQGSTYTVYTRSSTLASGAQYIGPNGQFFKYNLGIKP